MLCPMRGLRSLRDRGGRPKIAWRFPGAARKFIAVQIKDGGLPFLSGNGIPRGMTILFDMDDRARLPWRFFGATMTVLARLG